MSIKNALRRLMTLAVPAVFLASCGGSTGSDSDMASGCYTVAGTYNTVTASKINEQCGLGLTASDLRDNRTVTFDQASGVAKVTNSDTSQFATGSVKCNTGMLTYGPASTMDSSCKWTASRTVSFTATGTNQLTLDVVENRSNVSQLAGGGTCRQPPGGCSIQYTLTLAK